MDKSKTLGVSEDKLAGAISVRVFTKASDINLQTGNSFYSVC